MGVVIGVIIGLIICIVILGFLYGLLGEILRIFPKLVWILGIGGGLLVGCSSHWIAGIIVGFVLIGFLANAQQSDGNRCAHCGSYDTKVTEGYGHFKTWICNKCRNITYIK
ncbi:MAG: hypothetical protein LUH10_10115 [Tannerellaceae bacterium]|nr:hypothetical protein [Tannerellaceae bacterium]